VAAQRYRVDLGTGQEGQHQRSDAGQEGHYAGLGDMLADAGNVAGQRSDDYLDQRRRHCDLDADDRGEQSHAQPDGRHVVDVHRNSCQVGPGSSQLGRLCQEGQVPVEAISHGGGSGGQPAGASSG